MSHCGQFHRAKLPSDDKVILFIEFALILGCQLPRCPNLELAFTFFKPSLHSPWRVDGSIVLLEDIECLALPKDVFNRLKDRPTIPDKVYTDSSQFYLGTSSILSPVGLSDHGVVLCQPQPYSSRLRFEPSTTYKQAMLLVALKTLYLGRHLQSRLMYFKNLSSLSLNWNLWLTSHLPVKTVTRFSNDRPWVTNEFATWSTGGRPPVVRAPPPTPISAQ